MTNIFFLFFFIAKNASTEDRWRGLTNALAGLFCASLSSLSESRTTSPRNAFYPEGQLPLYASSGTNATLPEQKYVLYHAVLPSEAVCTENLTPFIKLLPCKSYAGFAELLNPHKLFGGWWYGMGIHATWHDGETDNSNVAVEEDIDPKRLGLSSKARMGHYKAGDESDKDKSKPSSITFKQDRGVKLKLTVGSVREPTEDQSHGESAGDQWGLQTLFGRNVTKLCPVTSKSDVRVLLPQTTGDLDSQEEKDDASPSYLKIVPLPVAKYRSRTYGTDVEREWDVVRTSSRGLNLTISHKNERPNTGTSPF